VFSSSANGLFLAEIACYDWKKSAEHSVQQSFSTVQHFEGVSGGG
jgi:hypothetical protein